MTEISPERAAIDFGSRWRRVILKICLTLLFYGFMSVLLFPSVSPASEQYMLNAPELKQAVEVPVNFSGGEGSASDPYLISSVDDLTALSNRVSGEETEMARYAASHYMQTADIDISSLEIWNPIGESREKPFAGVYDGGGHKIRHVRNLAIEDDEGRDMKYLEYGLFGVVSGDSDLRELGIVRNIQMESSLSIYCRSLRKGRSFGAIAGMILGGKLQNCSNIGDEITICDGVAEENYRTYPIVGGLIGRTEDSDIENCVNNARIYTYSDDGNERLHWDAGGIVGRMWLSRMIEKKALIKGCENRGSIEIQSASDVGGIVGGSLAILTDCRNFGDVKTVTTVSRGLVNCGGISGFQQKYVLRCYNEGNIEIQNGRTGGSLITNVGGISGVVGGIEESKNIGDIKVEIDYLNKNGSMYFDNGSYKEYYSADVHCGGLAGILDFYIDSYRGNGLLDITNTGNIKSVIKANGVPINISMGGIAGYYTEGIPGGLPMKLRKALNVGRLEIEGLTTDMTSYCGGIVGAVNFKMMRKGGSTLENCYSLDSVAEEGIGNNSRWRLFRWGKRFTSLGIDAFGERDNFEGLDFENVWTMSKDEPRMPVLKIFENLK